MKSAAIFAVIFACSCTHSVRFPIKPGTKVDERAHLTVWAADGKHPLHGVRFEDGYLVGVPSWQPPQCGECRIRIPIADIDSIQRRTFSDRRTTLLGVGLTAAFVTFLSIMSPPLFD